MLLAAEPLRLFHILSPARAVAVLTVMAVAYCGGGAGGAAAGKLSVEGAGGLCASDMLFSMPLHGRKHNSEGSQEKKEQKGNDDQENMTELNPLPEDYQQNGDEKAQS